jgi:hypothetical protein
MRIGYLIALILLLPASACAATIIGPAEFEQIWLLNNQRNLISRYQEHSEQFRRDRRPLWLLDIDTTANQTIRTTNGDMDAIMDRIGIHYQNPDYLLLVDWLSLIPQPQTTEGLTYGDLVLGRSWQHGENLGLTLGGRMQSTPKATQMGGQTVFDLNNNASNHNFGGFAHLNYGDWNFGTYFSDQGVNQANAIQFNILHTETRNLAGTFANLHGDPERNIASRNELGINLLERISGHELRASITATVPGGGKATVSNAYLAYRSPDRPGFRYSTGLFHTRLIDTNESLLGAKLGVEYKLEMGGEVTLGLYARKNAFGDIDAMVMKHEPVYSFTIRGRIGSRSTRAN